MEKQLFESLARESLDTFQEVVTFAELKIGERIGSTTDSFANSNTFTGADAYKKLDGIKLSEQKNFQALIKEPAIARIVTKDQHDAEVVFYIARKTGGKLPSGKTLASYGAPIGRLAELTPGDEQEVNGNIYYIQEVTNFTPKFHESWDSSDTQYRDDDDNIYTIPSLRSLIEENLGDEVDNWLAEDGRQNNIINGIRHQVRIAMGLRDKPTLDRFQGEIFRLPLDNRLILLGPPGTGKTTTLIKRLGQKLDRTILDSNEKTLIEKASSLLQHEQSWIMFTPSDLLKHYLKEAFNREEVPASDERIRTWSKHRDDIARNSFGILRTATSGKLILKNDFSVLQPNVISEPEQWFEDYKTFHEKRMRTHLEDGLKHISDFSSELKAALFEKLQSALAKLSARSLISVYRELFSIESKLNEELSRIKAETDDLTIKERNRLFNAHKDIFDRLIDFLQELKQDEEPDDEELFDNDDLDETPQGERITRKDAVNAYISAVKALARVTAQRRKLGSSSRASKIIGFLGTHIPDRESLATIGRLMILQNGIRRFINSKKLYVTGVTQSYVSFRKQNLKNNAYYALDKVTNQHVSSTELDAVILLMLQNAREILKEPFVSRNADSAQFSYLSSIQEAFRNQVMVDEATDFSSLQLACMYNLTSLETQSFFACGDFNQRVTTAGIRSRKQLEWVAKEITTRTVNIVYRQSRTLNKFAAKLLELQNGDTTTIGKVADESLHEGVPPALLEKSSIDKDIEWVAARIIEVEKSVKQLPTIAVLVNREELVKSTADRLSEHLADHNLAAIACKGGSLGEGTDVRVFDIQHIKGLEFEAVFFLGIDELAEKKPDLFDRYLYVGATRAATYLGLTCYNQLPKQVEPLRAFFTESWSQGKK